MKDVNYVHLTTLNTFNRLKGLFVPARKRHRKGGKGGGGSSWVGVGRCSHAGVGEVLTGWVGGGVHMLEWERGSQAGVGKGITGWSGLSLIYDEVIERNLP